MRHTAQPLTAGDRHGPVLFERALQRKPGAWRVSRRRGALLPSLEISTGPLLPPTTVSATTAWSAFTVTCFTVICCWPLPRWRSRASESRASVRAAFSASARYLVLTSKLAHRFVQHGSRIHHQYMRPKGTNRTATLP